jgi:hypothetical protein
VCLPGRRTRTREVPAEPEDPAVLTRRPRDRELVSVPPVSPGAGHSPTHRVLHDPPLTRSQRARDAP